MNYSKLCRIRKIIDFKICQHIKKNIQKFKKISCVFNLIKQISAPSSQFASVNGLKICWRASCANHF